MGWNWFSGVRVAALRIVSGGGIAAALLAIFAPLHARAEDAGTLVGQPTPWHIGLQPSVSPVADQMHNFHNLLLWIISLITAFVLILLVYVIVRFRASVNPVPSKTSHNTLIEVMWTVVPILILIVIAVPSFKLLYFADKAPDAKLTIKAIGHQWYWSYEYPDNGNFTFDANIVQTADLKPGQPRLLTADNVVVVPVNTDIRVLVTAADVIHSWAMPAFSVKKDAVPGRLNETWFRAEREGTFYGQCSELCGQLHGFMPIEVKVVSQEAFAKWAEEAKKKYASVDGSSPRLADASAVQ
jgi:cytochrome c oxidase subunit 2